MTLCKVYNILSIESTFHSLSLSFFTRNWKEMLKESPLIASPRMAKCQPTKGITAHMWKYRKIR
jgi:hypothetical protein